MVTDEQVRAVALFFFLSFMDEKVALQASEKAVAQLKAKGKSSIEAAVLIRHLRQNYEQHRELISRRQMKPTAETGWVKSVPVDLDPWIKFHQDAGANEVIAVILSRVLGFRDEAIASGLGISLGTARHRIGKGMRQLGLHAKNSKV